MSKLKKAIVCLACGREIVNIKYRKKTCGRPACTFAYRKIYRQLYYKKNKDKILKKLYLWRKKNEKLRAAQNKRYYDKKYPKKK